MTACSFASLALALALPRIVGGHPVPPGEHTETLALLRPTSARAGYELTCSAALIAPTVALTAAHCLDGLDAAAVATLRIAAGVDVEGGALTGPLTAVTRAVVHPSFRAHPLGQADLAVLTLAAAPEGARPAPFAQNLAAFRAGAGIGAAVTIVGYGRREDDGLGVKYEAATTIAAVTSHEALTADDGRDACAGDSGGPAWGRGPDGSDLVVGLVARGRTFSCGRGGYLTLTSDAACWIAREAALPPAPACLGAAPRYSWKELASTSARALCGSPRANATQRETVDALALSLAAPTCEALVAALEAATTLDLDFLMLRDLSPLAHLPRLTTLSVRGNRLTDVAALATLPALTAVALGGNDLTDVPALAGVAVHGRRRQLGNFAKTAFVRACRDDNLPSAARATVRAILWRTQTDDCTVANQRLLASPALVLDERGLTDLTPLADLPTVRRLSLAGNPDLTDVAALAGMEDLRALDLTGTAVVDLAPLAALVAEGLVIVKP